MNGLIFIVILFSFFSELSFSSENISPKVAIIGAGIGGLSSAYYLKKMGINADIYEANISYGGKFRSIAYEKGTFDSSLPFIGKDHWLTQQLAKELKVPIQKSIIQNEYFFIDDYIFESDSLFERFNPIVKILDENKNKEYLNETNIMEFIQDHDLGSSFKIFCQSYFRKNYGSELHHISAKELYHVFYIDYRHRIFELKKEDQSYEFEKGISDFIIKIFHQIYFDQMNFGHRLSKISKSQSNQYILHFEESNVDKLYDYVILALPIESLKIDIDINDIAYNLMDDIYDTDFGQSYKLFLFFEQAFWKGNKRFKNQRFELFTDDFWIQEHQSSSDFILSVHIGGNFAKTKKKDKRIEYIKSTIQTLERFFNYEKGTIQKFSNNQIRYKYTKEFLHSHIKKWKRFENDGIFLVGDEWTNKYQKTIEGSLFSANSAAKIIKAKISHQE